MTDISLSYCSDWLNKRAPFADMILKGVGQVMLQENAWTGLLLITGLWAGNWRFAVAAIIATIAGTLTASLMKYGLKEQQAGVYGFSPALTGVVLVFMFRDTFLIWMLVLAGGVLAALLQHFFIKRKVPGYTFPFIVVAWIFIFLLRHLNGNVDTGFGTLSPDMEPYWFFSSLLKGYGQVIFQGSLISGVLFFAGVVISNNKSALYGLTASLAGVLFSMVNLQPLVHLQAGLFGFNAVLTAIALVENKRSDFIWIALGVEITIIFHNLFIDFRVFDAVGGVLTFPFVAGTWITLLLQRWVLGREEVEAA